MDLIGQEYTYIWKAEMKKKKQLMKFKEKGSVRVLKVGLGSESAAESHVGFFFDWSLSVPSIIDVKDMLLKMYLIQTRPEAK